MKFDHESLNVEKILTETGPFIILKLMDDVPDENTQINILASLMASKFQSLNLSKKDFALYLQSFLDCYSVDHWDEAIERIHTLRETLNDS